MVEFAKTKTWGGLRGRSRCRNSIFRKNDSQQNATLKKLVSTALAVTLLLAGIITLSTPEKAVAGTSTDTRAFSDNWWLRTPGYAVAIASAVDSSGNVYSHGSFVGIFHAVRPTLFVNLSSLVGYKANAQVGTCDSGTDEGPNCVRFGGYAFDVIGIRKDDTSKSGICTMVATDGYTDNSGAECPNNTIALLLSSASDTKFSSSWFQETSNNYASSTLNTAMNNAYTAVSGLTLQPSGPTLSSMIVSRSLAGEASDTADGGNKCSGTAPGSRSFFPLSFVEASALYNGSGDAPPVITLTTSAPAQPNVITTWSVTHNTTTNAGDVTYSYSFDAGTGGGNATSYKYCLSDSSTCTPDTTLSVPDASATTLTSTLTAPFNVAHYFCVAAVNVVGTSTARCSGDAVRGHTIPASIPNGATYITNLQPATLLNAVQASVTPFDAPAHQIEITKPALTGDAEIGGNGATLGQYQYSTDDGVTWNNVPSDSYTWETESLVIDTDSENTSLASGTTYQVCLRASNAEVGGYYSDKQASCPSVTTASAIVPPTENPVVTPNASPNASPVASDCQPRCERHRALIRHRYQRNLLASAYRLHAHSCRRRAAQIRTYFKINFE
jgi:hypothetical protein